MTGHSSETETQTPSDRTTSIDSVPSPKVSIMTGDGQECEYLDCDLVQTFRLSDYDHLIFFSEPLQTY
jgi:hypothetical protein